MIKDIQELRECISSNREAYNSTLEMCLNRASEIKVNIQDLTTFLPARMRKNTRLTEEQRLVKEDIEGLRKSLTDVNSEITSLTDAISICDMQDEQLNVCHLQVLEAIVRDLP